MFRTHNAYKTALTRHQKAEPALQVGMLWTKARNNSQVPRTWRRSVFACVPNVHELVRSTLQRCLGTLLTREKTRECVAHAPTPMNSRTRALAHFGRSPPLPQPMSNTFPDPPFPPFPVPDENLADGGLAARAGCANWVIRTDLTQLLNFLRPIMGDSRRWTTPTSGLELSGQQEQTRQFR
jgi:hypothetical protein